jgi:hypothetical protein
VPLLTANDLAVALRARQAEIRPPAPMSFHQDRDASTQHVEEDLHPSGIVEAIERAEIFGERPLGQPYPISHIELRSQFQQPVRTRRGNESLNDSRRNGLRPLALHHHAGHSQRAVDRSPSIVLGIEDDEHVARKEGCNHRRELAGASDGPLTLGQKCAISLVFELNLGAVLLVWQGMHHEPSLPVGRDGGLISASGRRNRLIQHG